MNHIPTLKRLDALEIAMSSVMSGLEILSPPDLQRDLHRLRILLAQERDALNMQFPGELPPNNPWREPFKGV